MHERAQTCNLLDILCSSSWRTTANRVCYLRPIKQQGSTSGHTPRADHLEVLQGLDDSGSAFKMRFQKLELLIRYATLANSYRPLCSLASALCLLGHPDLAAPGQLACSPDCTSRFKRCWLTCTTAVHGKASVQISPWQLPANCAIGHKCCGPKLGLQACSPLMPPCSYAPQWHIPCNSALSSLCEPRYCLAAFNGAEHRNAVPRSCCCSCCWLCLTAGSVSVPELCSQPPMTSC